MLIKMPLLAFLLSWSHFLLPQVLLGISFQTIQIPYSGSDFRGSVGRSAVSKTGMGMQRGKGLILVGGRRRHCLNGAWLRAENAPVGRDASGRENKGTEMLKNRVSRSCRQSRLEGMWVEELLRHSRKVSQSLSHRPGGRSA